MILPNFLKINNMSIKSLIKFILICQIMFILLIKVHMDLPLYNSIKYIFCFIYITFVPGCLLIRVFRLHDLEETEFFLYSIGLSLFSIMLIGLFLNILGDFWKVHLLTQDYLLIGYFFFITLLCSLSYLIDYNYEENISFFNVYSFSYMILLICLPLISFIGVNYFFYYNNNILLLFMILFISIIPLLITFYNNKYNYVNMIAIYAVSLSLLFATSLISPYINGYDIMKEFYLSSMVVKNSFWDSSLNYNYNGMLSIVILAPVYSILLNIDLTYVYKIFFPLLFSLVPCCLYFIVKKQTDEKIALISSFFFIAYFGFYTEMTQLGRQQIAELFFILIISVVINKKLKMGKKSILYIIFFSSLTVSHYALNYISLFSFIILYVIIKIYNINTFNKIINFKSVSAQEFASSYVGSINLFTIIFYLIFTLSWNVIVASSSSFNSLVSLINIIINTIFTDFLNPNKIQGLSLILSQPESMLHKITKYMGILLILFISIGIFSIITKYKKSQFTFEYKILSLINFFICVCGISIPYFSNAINASRLYQISLIIVAPFILIGFKDTLNLLEKISKIKINNETGLKIISVFLSLYLLFNSGWIYEITNDAPIWFALNKNVNYTIFHEAEIAGAKWFYAKTNSTIIYADDNNIKLLDSLNGENVEAITSDGYIPGNAFIFLGNYNVKNKILFIVSIRNDTFVEEYMNSTNITNKVNKIYATSYCEIFLK